MLFKELNAKINCRFQEIQKSGKLFRLNISGDKIWDAYINGFLSEEDPVFRDPNSTTHTCNDDMNFIRRYGNVVGINTDLEIISMFDIDVEDTEYEHAISAVKRLIKTAKIESIFVETWDELNSLPYEKCSKNAEKFQLGKEKTVKIYSKEEVEKFGVVCFGEPYTFHHFYVFLDAYFVDTSGASIARLMGNAQANVSVFKRGLEEISLDTLELVKDLIIQGSLLQGEAHLQKVTSFIQFKKLYDQASHKDNWCWVNGAHLPTAKFRNELIGTLCVELTEGMDLNTACLNWNKRVDPANYMKAKSPITQRQINEAKKFVEENGYVMSFDRRFATIDDININDIRHMNIGTQEEKPAGLFSNVPASSTQHKRSQFDGIQEVSIDTFMRDILPTCKSMQVYLENRHECNLMALITSNSYSKPIFKWNNMFSWTYRGNLTGKSQIKENVKSAGGSVTGLIRCSLQWNDKDTPGIVDYDLHCVNNGDCIYYSNKHGCSGGVLDVDMIRPQKIGVENITWQKMPSDGKYQFYVHTYCGGRNSGFKVEIEYNGITYNYHYNKPTQQSSYTKVATLTINKGEISIEHHLSEISSSRTIWNLETEKFHDVNLVCLSPNHWGDNSVGNKHVFFFLKGCKSDVPLRTFHNEYLIGDLLTHRKVLEVLADTTRVQPADKQLAGLGFCSENTFVIAKITGSHQRTIKIIF